MKEISIAQIEKYLEQQHYRFKIIGKQDNVIRGFSSLSKYKEDTMTWIKSNKVNILTNKNTKIALCVVQEGAEIDAETKIITPDSKAVFFSLIDCFWGDDDLPKESVGKGTVIGAKVQIGKNVFIGTNCSIIGDIFIGDNTVIGDNVVIRNRVHIGCECQIQSLTVIGEDGFGYSEDSNYKKTMIRHYGGVYIGDRVFIGSHVNIARAVIDDTVIEEGVKIAPSTHIGHNDYIGEDSTIICSKLFGSVKIGSNAYITASVVRNQARIGDNAFIGMGSVVTKDIDASKVAFGAPAKVIKDRK